MTLFPILNLKDLNIHYRLVEISGLPFELGEDDQINRNLNLLVTKVAYDNRAPVALIRQNGRARLAVPYDLTLINLKYTLTPDVATLRPDGQKHEIRFSDLNRETALIANSFLSFALRTPLRENHALWSGSPFTFYDRTPVNYKDASSEADLYKGFSFRLLNFDGGIYLAVHLSHKYIDRHWLTERVQSGRINNFHMRRALYHMGHQWFVIQLLGITGKNIKEQEFDPDDGSPTTTVLKYTLAKVGPKPPNWIQMLDPNTPAINYKYPNRDIRRYGALALCKLIHATSDSSALHLHRRSIKTPDERILQSQELVRKYFQKATLAGIPISVSTQPLEVQPKVFPVPDLIFGQETVLRVQNPNTSGGIPLRELGRNRIEYLLNPSIGALVTSGFDAQYIIAPLGFEREIVQDFKDRFENTIRQLTHGAYRAELVVYDDQNAKTLKQQVDAIVDAVQKVEIRHGYAILILPRGAKPDLHNFIKRRLYRDYQCACQCVQSQSLSGFYELTWEGERHWNVKKELNGRYISYLRYTALGHLIVNRKWPWALSSPLHHDVHIGLDVLANTAAFSFLYEGGRKCFLDLVESQQKEKLSSRQMREVIYKNLEDHLPDLKTRPSSIVIYRDGKTFLDEWNGFQSAIQKLVSEGILPKDVKYGIVEIHKNNALHVRIVSRQGELIRNPKIGSWRIFNDRDGILCTTGFPFHLQGTVDPLYIYLPYGNLDLREVLQDTFDLSLLCWMVPDRCCRLPIPVKLADDFLRPVASDADEDEAIFGDFSEHDESIEEAVVLNEGKEG
jgi:hypothetical protein